MEIHINDPEEKISKTQKQKVRQMFKNNVSKDEILNSIYYSDNKMPYKDFKEIKESESKITLDFVNYTQRDELKQKLKNKLTIKTSERTNDYKNDAWKMYYQLLRHPSVQQMSNDTVKKMIPNPDEIKKQAELYRMINQQNPVPMIKNYIDTCLTVQ